MPDGEMSDEWETTAMIQDTDAARGGDDAASLRELLELYLWDLYAGCRTIAGRLPQVASHAADADWRTEMGALPEAAWLRAQRMHAVRTELSAEPEAGEDHCPDNLWMQGILDDMDRDTRAMPCGRALDLAMAGALRKAIAAELASIRTAKAIAVRLGHREAVQALSVNEAELRGDEGTLDQRLMMLA